MKGILWRAWRGIREQSYLFVVGVGVVAGALFLLGLFAMVASNFRAALGAWRTDVHVSAYFEPGLSAETQETARAAIAARPDVASAELTTSDQARAWMAERMPDLDPVVGELGTDVLPASVEITLKDRAPSGETLAAFAQSLQGTGSFSQVDYGEDWVRRFQAFVTLLDAMGLGLGVAVAAAAALMIGNTIQLGVHARRDEVEIMRLVGATDGYVMAPFLVEGVAQGVVGGTLALLGLYGVHRGLILQLQEMFAVAFGGQELGFLPAAWIVALLFGGAALGFLSAYGGVRRFLRALV